LSFTFQRIVSGCIGRFVGQGVCEGAPYNPFKSLIDSKQCENASSRRQTVIEALGEEDSASQRLVVGADDDFSLGYVVDYALGIRPHLPFDVSLSAELPVRGGCLDSSVSGDI
jgi:hypothetical protein